MREELKQYVDMESALNRVRGNKVLYRRMLDMLLAATEFQTLEDNLAANDYVKAAETAHTIKGMTGNLSLPAIFESSTALMQQLRQGPPEEALLATYRDAKEKTIAAIHELIAELDPNA